MPKMAIWISYDLGIRGDYPSLYSWLDENDATECGNSIAFLRYSYKKDLLKELKDDLKNAGAVGEKSRVYVVYLNSEKHRVQGRFLMGGRKSPPWAGFASSDSDEIDVSDET